MKITYINEHNKRIDDEIINIYFYSEGYAVVEYYNGDTEEINFESLICITE